MLRLHREGKATIFWSLVVLFALNLIVRYLTDTVWVHNAIMAFSVVVMVFFMQFFRNPLRSLNMAPDTVIAPADGKVVLVEEVDDAEYFEGKRLQVSIFMSPLNVHVNRYPVTGTVTYAKHHRGEFLVAWHPKASVLNERTTVIQKTEKGVEVGYRQIAGALARRIVMYAKVGKPALQASESGFIKFGSRVDILLPLGTEVLVKPGEMTRGGETAIAKLG
jgi:phosphatidylserine decarboxylase